MKKLFALFYPIQRNDLYQNYPKETQQVIYEIVRSYAREVLDNSFALAIFFTTIFFSIKFVVQDIFPQVNQPIWLYACIAVLIICNLCILIDKNYRYGKGFYGNMKVEKREIEKALLGK